MADLVLIENIYFCDSHSDKMFIPDENLVDLIVSFLGPKNTSALAQTNRHINSHVEAILERLEGPYIDAVRFLRNVKCRDIPLLIHPYLRMSTMEAILSHSDMSRDISRVQHEPIRIIRFEKGSDNRVKSQTTWVFFGLRPGEYILTQAVRTMNKICDFGEIISSDGSVREPVFVETMEKMLDGSVTVRDLEFDNLADSLSSP